ncbi:MAG TPA: ABC transporter permease [Peptococcaceae bacterium]|nr:ABC transporter permease [Peptococcaceae bacterium]
MKNTLKVAKWEIKRNVTNKAFLISILITPLLMLLFGFVPSLLAKFETDQPFTLYVVDKLGIYERISQASSEKLIITLAEDNLQALKEKTRGRKDQGYVVLDENALATGLVTVYTDNEGKGAIAPITGVLQTAFNDYKMEKLGLSKSQIDYLKQPYQVNVAPLTKKEAERSLPQKIIPAVFAGILFLTVFTSGTMTFQSALQEKKDKMVEIILSSVQATDLMQGKILGYFVLGLIQVGVWLLFGIPAAQFFFKIPILEYLFVPELLPMVFFALAGYLLYSAIFVAIGATMEDAQSGSSFQGMIFLIPMLPLFVIGPIIANPSGVIARIGTFFPLTTPGVMLARLSISTQTPLWEILASGTILLLTTLLVMRLAGKLFKTAILMYGKNATLAEIIKWLRY